MIDLRDALRVKPGSQVHLSKQDPKATFGWDKAGGEPELEHRVGALESRQRHVRDAGAVRRGLLS